MAKGRKALVLGGGAPNYTLMTGALLAFDEAGVKFDVITMAGGGAVVGLTYLAPKGFVNPQDALRNSVNLGVSDLIYDFLPMNYKVFEKAGVAADLFRQFLSICPGYELIMNQYRMTQGQKLLSDWIQMIWAIMTPGITTPASTGLCAHAPFVDDLVDFDKLKTVATDFYLNTYCVTDERMVILGKHEVTAEHFKACLAFPFIYSPYEWNGKKYIEGAAVDAFNFRGLVEREPDVKTIVVFDIMLKGLIQAPEGLWDAYGQSMIVPLVALSRADLKLFENIHNRGRYNILKVPFEIPPSLLPTALDWSSSNLNDLFEVGYQAGKKFVEKHGPDLDKI